MSALKRTHPLAIARQMRAYQVGERVKILRGVLAGKIMTITQSGNDWVMLKERPRRDLMSKQNVEPETGFTDEEMVRARRAADRM